MVIFNCAQFTFIAFLLIKINIPIIVLYAYTFVLWNVKFINVYVCAILVLNVSLMKYILDDISLVFKLFYFMLPNLFHCLGIICSVTFIVIDD